VPLNWRTLKHVSALIVICLGGGAGNESVYADEVPNGRVIILLEGDTSVLLDFEDGRRMPVYNLR
jgi:hypothetical protein